MESTMGRLRSAITIPGWILLAWTVLGEIHVATFTVELFHKVNDFIQGHILVGLVVGFVWLFLATKFPAWKQRLPAWAILPETLHERVHRLDAECARDRNSHGELHAGFENRIKTAEQNDKIFGEWIQAAQIRNGGYDDRLSTLEERVKAIPVLFSDLTELKKATGDAIQPLRASATISDSTIELLPAYFKYQGSIGGLKTRIELAIDDFLALQNTYPASQPATQPFSDWRPEPGATPSDPAIQTAERLAQSLEVYVGVAQSFALRSGRDVFSGALFALVSSWRQPPTTKVSGDDFLALLRKHYTNLEEMELEYAVLWSKKVRGVGS
jgi:hypothetical protein